MAHQLSIREDGAAEMAYVGEVPWHRLGTKLAPNAPKDRWREAAGFDHEILSAHPHLYTKSGDEIEIIDRLGLYRSDNDRPLGIVSADYKVVQPSEVLDFFDDIVKAGDMTLETAGTLFGGKQYWCLAKIGEKALFGVDRLKGYLLLSTSCDGSRKTVAKFTCVRVVCDNTLTLSDRTNLSGAMIEVSHRSHFDADAVKKALGVAPKTFTEFMASLEVLAGKKVRKPKAKELTEAVFGEEARAVPHVLDLFAGDATGYDMPNIKGTAWGWLNSVTEYVDWQRFAKTDSHRISNSLLGEGDKLKRKAYDLALEYAS